MSNNDNLLLEFFDYVVQEYQKTLILLEPYFIKLEEREKAGMNVYGVATPNDKRLLNKMQALNNLKSLAGTYENLEQLKTFLTAQKKVASEENVSSIETQLQEIDKWLQKRTANPPVNESSPKL